jgi:hypothetical protein
LIFAWHQIFLSPRNFFLTIWMLLETVSIRYTRTRAGKVINASLKLSAGIVALSLITGAAIALPPSSVSSPPRQAPAPLLAAGIPAFLALGGGAFVGRMMRRKKTAVSETSSDGT